jgi:hypothetical protein
VGPDGGVYLLFLRGTRQWCLFVVSAWDQTVVFICCFCVGPDSGVYFTSTHLATKGTYLTFVSTQEQFPVVPNFNTSVKKPQGQLFDNVGALLALYAAVCKNYFGDYQNQEHLLNDSRIFALIYDLQIISVPSGYLKNYNHF